MASSNGGNINLDRLYTIRYQPPEVFTPGKTGSGDLVLFGMLTDTLIVVIYFFKDGHYSHYRFYPIIREPDPSLPQTITWQKARILEETLADCIRDLEITRGDIQIRHFAFPEWDIGVAEWYFGDYPDVEKSIATGIPLQEERLIEWQQQKKWVMHWKNEFEMSDDGEVLSS